MTPIARIRVVDQLARSLVSAVHTSVGVDPLEDAAVAMAIQDIREARLPRAALYALAQMTRFALGHLNAARILHQLEPLTFEAMRDIMAGEESIDVDLLHDCFAVLEAPPVPRPRGTTVDLSGRTLQTWGPYALVTVSHVYLRVVRTLAAHHETDMERLLRHFALAHERDLLTLDANKQGQPEPRTSQQDTDGA